MQTLMLLCEAVQLKLAVSGTSRNSQRRKGNGRLISDCPRHGAVQGVGASRNINASGQAEALDVIRGDARAPGEDQQVCQDGAM